MIAIIALKTLLAIIALIAIMAIIAIIAVTAIIALNKILHNMPQFFIVTFVIALLNIASLTLVDI